MKHKYEAKFLSIDVADLQARLKNLGAVQAFPQDPPHPKDLRKRRPGRRRLGLRDESTLLFANVAE